jgi:hypothetical protein
MFISLRDAYLFNLNVNETRTVNDMVFSLESYNNKSHLPKELDFMVFQLPEDRNKYNDIDLMNLSDYLKNTPGNFYLIGDTSILYGITNKPSVSPTLWFHPGLTIPDETSDDFIIYEKQLQNNISKFKVRFVVLEGNCTFMGSDLSNFRQLYLRLTTSACPPISFGPFLVFELCR